MTPDRLIRKCLDDLNQQKATGQIITRQLTDKVELAKVWPVPLAEDNPAKPLQAYLIKESNLYIGAVLESDNGMFAYMLPTHRRKSKMSNALRQTILPHLLQHKPIIRLHISQSNSGVDKNFNAARKLALAVGFEELQGAASGCRMTMDASGLKERVFIKGQNTGISAERKATLKNRLSYAASLLIAVQTELEYKCGISGYSEELSDLIRALSGHTEKLDQAWFEK